MSKRDCIPATFSWCERLTNLRMLREHLLPRPSGGQPDRKQVTSFASPDRRRLSIALSVIGLAATCAVRLLGHRTTADLAAIDLISSSEVMGSSASAKPVSRCEWVIGHISSRDSHKTRAELEEAYSVVASDPNKFFRGTASMFWHDFVLGGWGNFDLASLGIPAGLADGSPLQRTSTWTWITGDQHLSNFGAWKNRHGDIVFGVNDFDEAAIFDFQIDVWRCAVSIYSHALSNGLGKNKARTRSLRRRPAAHYMSCYISYLCAQALAAVITFTGAYVGTLQSYVGNERALLFEVTPNAAFGPLAEFLQDVAERNGHHNQMVKYTELDHEGNRRLIKNSHTKLAPVSAAVESQIRDAFSSTGYGATLQRIGWHTVPWSENAFRVLDVAQRVGSGVGSYGVARYYVLINAKDAPGGGSEQRGIILDVKQETQAAIRQALPLPHRVGRAIGKALCVRPWGVRPC